ncbi:MAG: hypothetical protein WCW52_09850 [Elusimicrobiales bacterium]
MVVLLLGAVGCHRPPSQDPAQYSKALIVLPGAMEVKYSKYRGTDQVFYKLTESYPASQALKQISAQLKVSGWIALKEDALNPGTPTSHVIGWENYIDKTGKVYQWLADWKNENGDMLRYALQYRSTKTGTQISDMLQVTVIFSPAAIFNAALDATHKDTAGSPS